MAVAAAMVAVAAATAIASNYQAEKARGASEKRLKEIEAAFRAIVPPKYDLSPMDPPEFIMQRIEKPDFDTSHLTPKAFEVVGKFVPQAADFVKEVAPQLIEETSASREGLQAQRDALRRFRQIADSDSDPILAQELQDAAENAQVAAQSRTQSILQDEARRGMLGSGTALAASLQGASDAMGRAADQSSDAAIAAYKNRLQALRDSANLGGTIRDSEFRRESANTGILNDFNQRSTARYQSFLDRKADMENQAQLHNLGVEQQVSNMNTENANKFAVMNRERDDDIKKFNYGADVDALEYKNQLIGSKYDAAKAERDRQDELKQMQFKNELAKTAGVTGSLKDMAGLDIQKGQDKVAAIQGVGNAAMSGLNYYGNAKAREREQDREDERWKMIYGS